MSKTELNPEDQTGFDRPSQPGDDIVAKLREKWGLPENASLAEIEPVAKTLLKTPLTTLSAAELVLNRRVDSKEKFIGQLIFSPLDIDERFGLLLLEKTTEYLMRKQGLTDFDTK